MTKFRGVKVGQLGDIITGKTPKTSIKENYGSDYMFIGPTDLHKHFIITNSEKYISKLGFNSIKNNTISGLSILVGCIGWDMGNVALVDKKCATNQQINSITNINEGFDPYYIYYWFKGKKAYLFKISNVTRTPMLNKTDFSDITIQIPNFTTQKQIAKVLSDLDAKIEVNNKINAELEAMAKLIYDYWFVQFDFPFDFAQGKPDPKGKPYKSSGGKMVYNKELKREIPEGWEVKELSEVSEIKAGGDKPKSLTKEKTKENNIPIYSNGISNEGLYGYTNNAKIEKESITVSARGTIGYCVLRLKPFVPIIRLLSVTPNDSNEIKYLFESIKNLVFENSGSVQQQLTVPQISKLKIISPPTYLINKYQSLARPGLDTIEINKNQNQELSELRDWLLPMLMNGQVTVANEELGITNAELGNDLGMVAEENATKYGEN